MKHLPSADATPATLHSRFQYADGRLFFARARLYADRLELGGWGWRGPHRRTVRLDEIARVDWIPQRSDGVNFALHLRSGETLRLRMAGAGLWKYEIKDRARALGRAASPRPLARTADRLRKAG